MNNQNKRPNPKFALDFKHDAVKLIKEKGYAHQQVVDSLGISLSAIGCWSGAERVSANRPGSEESRYFCESLFWASQPKQAAKT